MRSERAKGGRKRSAFTLIELLVVIAIICLLVSILIPSLQRAREIARDVKCRTNLKAMGTGMQLYVADNNECQPPRWSKTYVTPGITKAAWDDPANAGKYNANLNLNWYDIYENRFFERLLVYCDSSYRMNKSVNFHPGDAYARLMDCPSTKIKNYDYSRQGGYFWDVAWVAYDRTLQIIATSAGEQYIRVRGIPNPDKFLLVIENLEWNDSGFFINVPANTKGLATYMPHKIDGGSNNVLYLSGRVAIWNRKYFLDHIDPITDQVTWGDKYPLGVKD